MVLSSSSESDTGSGSGIVNNMNKVRVVSLFVNSR